MFEVMRSRELAEFLGVSDRYVKKLTKQAIDNGKKYIEYKGRVIYFREVEGSVGRGGKSYEYYDITDIEVSTRETVFCPDVPDIDIKRASVEDKLAIVKYYLSSNVSYLAIAKSLVLKKMHLMLRLRV